MTFDEWFDQDKWDRDSCHMSSYHMASESWNAAIDAAIAEFPSPYEPEHIGQALSNLKVGAGDTA